jgi:hypothetical protein
MAYVMIAVFPIEELPDVIREFVTSGRVKVEKPNYEGNVVKATPELSKKRTKHPIGHDRNLLLEFIRQTGDVGYDDIMSADLGIADQSLAYNLNYLIDKGEIVRVGEKPYRYKISETKKT